jgi:hypothetical protein
VTILHVTLAGTRLDAAAKQALATRLMMLRAGGRDGFPS